ncbi:MAG: hypothetical protein M3Y56_06500, partial [Armatimonadota bacterium]|nr:hypothetical protein [Armatimonadota bacterium]
VGLLQRPAPAGAFRDLALRFGFVWAVTNLCCLGVALVATGIGLLFGTHLGIIPIAIYAALIWSFILDIVAVRALFNMDFGRSVLVVLVAHAIGDGLAIALMELVIRSIR